MFQKEGPSIVEITRELVDHLIEINTYPAQRKMRPAHVAKICDSIQKGTVTDISFSIAVFNDSKGRPVEQLINGQHMASALSKTYDFKQGWSAALWRFYCQTPRDLADAFTYTDQSLSRSLSDRVKVIAEERDNAWSPMVGSLVASSLALGPEGEVKERRGDRKMELLREHHEFAGWCQEHIFINRTPFKHLAKAPVVAAILKTYEANKKEAQAFWPRVRDGEMMSADAPEYRLRQYLLQGGVTSQLSGRRREVIAKCIMAWNAYRKGKATSLRYSPGAEMPKASR